MTERTLEKIAKDFGTEVVYKKYRYWDSVPHINDTALCFDVTNENGSITIAYDPEYFPKFVTIEYVTNAIEDKAENLGWKNYAAKGFGVKKIHPYEKPFVL